MMKCPECGNQNTLIVDSRLINKGERRWRRKECSDCGIRFSTYETHEVKLKDVPEHKSLLQKAYDIINEATHPKEQETPPQETVDISGYENQIIELHTQVEHEKGLRKEAQSKVDELEIQNLFDQKHFVPGQSHLQIEFARLQGRLEREKKIRNEFENQLRIERSRISKLKIKNTVLRKVNNET